MARTQEEWIRVGRAATPSAMELEEHFLDFDPTNNR